jgi:hypothetical protein
MSAGLGRVPRYRRQRRIGHHQPIAARRTRLLDPGRPIRSSARRRGLRLLITSGPRPASSFSACLRPHMPFRSFSASVRPWLSTFLSSSASDQAPVTQRGSFSAWGRAHIATCGEAVQVLAHGRLRVSRTSRTDRFVIDIRSVQTDRSLIAHAFQVL